MKQNIIQYPDAADWHNLAQRTATNPRAMRAVNLLAAEEIAHLRRECIRAGITPGVRRNAAKIAKQLAR